MAKWTLVTNSVLVDKKTTPIFGIMIVGRESGCDLLIKRNEVSRKHAELSVRNKVLFIKDLGSANGTTVNGTQINGEVALNLGDKVVFEAVEFTVNVAQEAQAVSAVAGGSVGAQTAVVQSVSSDASAATQMQLSAGTTFLTIVRGSAPVDRIDLDNIHALKIGRSGSCDLVLNDATVSGEHVQMTLENDGWHIANISQTNGLFINGNKVLKYTLQDGDTIELGAAVLKFDTDNEGGSDGDRKIPDWMRDQG